MSYKQAINLASRSVSPSDRVLIIGATGWFGRTVLALLNHCGAEFLLISSTDNEFSVENVEYQSHVWDQNKIVEFSPTIVIDCAFLTRDFLFTMTLDKYVMINRSLIENLLFAAGLNSVTRVISISSGAAVEAALNGKVSVESDPYGILKLQLEEQLAQIAIKNSFHLVIARAWSVSGSLVRKPKNYAFSDLILQAQSGEVIISSTHEVWRRYCSAEELLAVAIAISENRSCVFSSGGVLIEVQDLAKVVIEEINPNAKLKARKSITGSPNRYYSDNEEWDFLCAELELKTLDLRQQVRLVGELIH